jgi:N-acetylmuramoyl-L-alanine amidase
MTGTYLTDLADVCRGAAGDDVFEVEGWEYRARGSGGYDPGRPWVVMWHHTASNTDPANDVAYICYGNPDAPVSNLYIDRTGAVWVCAGGATNTNGKGGPFTVSHGTVPLDQMNTYAVSIEIANTGTGEPWPQQQVDAVFAVSLAVCAAYGLEPDDICTHHAWCLPSCPGRKIDPATADAVQGPWRPTSASSAGSWALEDIAAECRRRAAPTPPPTPPGDDVMNYYVVTGANAKFIGFPPLVRWTGPGDDRMTAALQTQIDAGNLITVELTGGPNAFAATILEGPLPTGDSLHDWTGDEFANAAELR